MNWKVESKKLQLFYDDIKNDYFDKKIDAVNHYVKMKEKDLIEVSIYKNVKGSWKNYTRKVERFLNN